MRLTILGCSGSVGGPQAACSGYLLQVDGHDPVVMDFGPGVLGELQQRVDPNTATVMLSHLHADHCLDLPSLLVWRRYHPTPASGRARLLGPSDTPERIGRASAETASLFDDITDTFDFGSWVEGQDIAVGGFTARPFRMYHPPESFGLRITAPSGRVLAYGRYRCLRQSGRTRSWGRCTSGRGQLDPRPRQSAARRAPLGHRGGRGRAGGGSGQAVAHTHPAVDVPGSGRRGGHIGVRRPRRCGQRRRRLRPVERRPGRAIGWGSEQTRRRPSRRRTPPRDHHPGVHAEPGGFGPRGIR